MSLRWRILRVLTLMTALMVSLSLGLGYYAARQQFDAFVDELGRREAKDLAGRLSRAYTEAAGWETLEAVLAEEGYLYEVESEHGEGDEGESEESALFHIDRIRIVIVNLAGWIIHDNFAEFASAQAAPDLAGQRTEILDLQIGQTVGYAYVDVNQDFLASESLGFLRELLLRSIIGGLLIIAMALLLATSLSKRITAPVTALTQAMTQLDDAAPLPVASDDELGRMSMAFNQMTRELHKQRGLRKSLIDDVSHELNTPLTVIQLEAKGLLDGLQKPTQAARRIIQEVRMLHNLVNDLNWLAETDSGEAQFKLESCALDQLLISEVERWQPPAQAQHISLSLRPLPTLPTLQLDPMRIRQALGNIIHNALQHTPQGQVAVAATIKDDEYLQISVTDDGAGIAASDLPHLFHRFYRTAPSRGRGLGLDIARAIIEAHGGSIAVHSDGVGRGARVEFRLPLPD